MNNLNNIYLINNHIRHPSSQQHHLDKLLIAAIVHEIYWTAHKISIHKVRAHTESPDMRKHTLANEGALKVKASSTPHIHITHTTPNWLAS